MKSCFATALFLMGTLFVSSVPAVAGEYEDAMKRFEITELMYRYAIMHNTMNVQGYADLFDDDAAIYEEPMHQELAHGRAKILAVAQKDAEKYGPGQSCACAITSPTLLSR